MRVPSFTLNGPLDAVYRCDNLDCRAPLEAPFLCAEIDLDDLTTLYLMLCCDCAPLVGANLVGFQIEFPPNRNLE